MPYVFYKMKDGRKVWYTNCWDPQRRCKIKKRVGTSKREAEEVAGKLHAKILARSLDIRPKLEVPTLDEFIPRFLTENYAGKATMRESERALRRFRGFAGNIPLNAVTKGLVHDYISRRRLDRVPAPFRGKSRSSPNAKTWTPTKTIRNGTINRDVDAIKRMLSFAHEHEIIESNALAGLKKLSTKDGKRKPMLPPEQIQRLLDEASRAKAWRFYPALVLALYTGRRRSDLFKRRTTDYNATQGLLYLGKTKRGEDEVIQLGGAARSALDALFDQAVGGWLFPNATGTEPIKDVDTAFREAKKRAGIDPKLRWHDLRHVSISLMIMSGVDCNTVAALVGHTTATMVETTYGHLSLRHKQATAVTFGGYLDRITGLGSGRSPMQSDIFDRPVSAQVADLISGEAAREIVATRLLPEGAPPLSRQPAIPSGPGEK